MTFHVVTVDGHPCLTISEIAEALYGKAPQGGSQIATPLVTRVRDLYRRHADEFTKSP